jgi:hypothetical protein
VTVVSGRLLGEEIERLVLEYEDGDGVEIPFTWVSSPIDAGFYLYEVPGEHRRRGHRAAALVATDDDGGEVARQTFRLPRPGDVERPVRLPDGITAQLQARALVDKARRVIEITLENGQHRSLWVMPTTDGGQCYVHNGGGGCSQPGGPEPHPLGAGLQGGPTVLIAGQVRSDVATYELHYQDGTIERLRPVEGFILHEIVPAHYPQGTPARPTPCTGRRRPNAGPTGSRHRSCHLPVSAPRRHRTRRHGLPVKVTRARKPS